MLSDIPDGTQCFVYANIFYYHFVNTPPFSDDRSDTQLRPPNTGKPQNSSFAPDGVFV